MSKQRRIVCAAIRAVDGELLLGVRHYDNFMHRQTAKEHFGGEVNIVTRCVSDLESGSCGGIHSPFVHWPRYEKTLDRAEKAEADLAALKGKMG